MYDWGEKRQTHLKAKENPKVEPKSPILAGFSTFYNSKPPLKGHRKSSMVWVFTTDPHGVEKGKKSQFLIHIEAAIMQKCLEKSHFSYIWLVFAYFYASRPPLEGV